MSGPNRGPIATIDIELEEGKLKVRVRTESLAACRTEYMAIPVRFIIHSACILVIACSSSSSSSTWTLLKTLDLGFFLTCRRSLQLWKSCCTS